MELHIKNMVCDRCNMAVAGLLEQLDLHPDHVELGLVRVREALSEAQLAELDRRLREIGFELLDDRHRQTIEKIRTAVIGLIRHEGGDKHIKHSEYLAKQLGRDYSTISKLFSEAEGLTLEQYIIQQKIERVKELLTYGELTLSEIAWQLGYSSVAAASAQFKKVVGITPSEYKASADKARKPLDSVGRADEK